MLYDQLNQTECTAGQILKWSAVKKVHVLILFNFWKSQYFEIVIVKTYQMHFSWFCFL